MLFFFANNSNSGTAFVAIGGMVKKDYTVYTKYRYTDEGEESSISKISGRVETEVVSTLYRDFKTVGSGTNFVNGIGIDDSDIVAMDHLGNRHSVVQIASDEFQPLDWSVPFRDWNAVNHELVLETMIRSDGFPSIQHLCLTIQADVEAVLDPDVLKKMYRAHKLSKVKFKFRR